MKFPYAPTSQNRWPLGALAVPHLDFQQYTSTRIPYHTFPAQGTKKGIRQLVGPLLHYNHFCLCLDLSFATICP